MSPHGIAGLPDQSSWKLFTPSTGLSLCQISSGSDNLSAIYLVPNFVDFVKSVSNKQGFFYIYCNVCLSFLVRRPVGALPWCLSDFIVHCTCLFFTISLVLCMKLRIFYINK